MSALTLRLYCSVRSQGASYAPSKIFRLIFGQVRLAWRTVPFLRLDSPQGQWARRWRRLVRPAWLGTVRRSVPLSDEWGYDRGTPIDRYYIAAFLREHHEDIRGRSLEVRGSEYIDRYGTGVERRDILDIDPTNPRATIVADLSEGTGAPSDAFDCFVLTQTLQFIPNTHAAVTHAHRMLKPGGVLLATVPSVSRLAPWHGLKTDYWRFTPASCVHLFEDIFGAGRVTIQSYGNVLAGVAFLLGMAREELSIAELDVNDPYFPLIIGVRAVKA